MKDYASEAKKWRPASLDDALAWKVRVVCVRGWQRETYIECVCVYVCGHVSVCVFACVCVCVGV